ncbi:hypothetical protein ACJJTC_001400 [Scirpophaga incertulas]
MKLVFMLEDCYVFRHCDGLIVVGGICGLEYLPWGEEQWSLVLFTDDPSLDFIRITTVTSEDSLIPRPNNHEISAQFVSHKYGGRAGGGRGGMPDYKDKCNSNEMFYGPLLTYITQILMFTKNFTK